MGKKPANKLCVDGYCTASVNGGLRKRGRTALIAYSVLFTGVHGI